MLRGRVDHEVDPSYFHVPSNRIRFGLQSLRLDTYEKIEYFYNSRGQLETNFGRFSEADMPAICFARSWTEMLNSWQIDATTQQVLSTVNQFGNPNDGWDDDGVTEVARHYGCEIFKLDLYLEKDLVTLRQKLNGTKRFLATVMEVAPDQIYDSSIQFEEHWVVFRSYTRGEVVKIDSSERQMFTGGRTNGKSILQEIDMLKIINCYSLDEGRLNRNETRVSPTSWSGPVGFLIDKPTITELHLTRPKDKS